jgi:hypothetical protein
VPTLDAEPALPFNSHHAVLISGPEPHLV